MQDMLNVNPEYNYWATMASMPLGINLERIFAQLVCANVPVLLPSLTKLGMLRCTAYTI